MIEYPDHDVMYIHPKFSKIIYSYYYIIDDLMLGKAYVEKIMAIINKIEETGDRSDEITAEGLWYGMIAIYGRCFTKVGSGFVKLETSIFESNTEIRRTHESLMDTRHKFVAHRDDTFMMESALSLVVNKMDVKSARFIVKTQRNRFNKEELNHYSILFDYLLIKVEESQKKQTGKMIKQLLALGPEKVHRDSELEIQRLIDTAGSDLNLIFKEIQQVAIKSILSKNL